MKGEMSITALIPNYNRRDALHCLLGDLRHQTRPPEAVIVVDNGSSDGAAELAQANGATVIRLGSNRGFAHAVNRGIAAAATPWIAILNNDVRLPPAWLATLFEAAAAGHWFAAGKLLSLHNPRIIDGAFDLLCRGACAWRAGHGRPDGPLWNSPRPVCFVPFTAALFRRELFAQVGLLDEAFESYLEDVEFGLRCALRGFTGIYAPQAVAYHQGSATFGEWSHETVRRIARNQLLLVAKHYPPNWLRRYGWQIFLAQTLWGVLAVRRGAAWAWAKGKWEGLRLLRSRQPSTEPRLDSVLEACERELVALQRQTGFDWMWRLYCRLA